MWKEYATPRSPPCSSTTTHDNYPDQGCAGHVMHVLYNVEEVSLSLQFSQSKKQLLQQREVIEV